MSIISLLLPESQGFALCDQLQEVLAHELDRRLDQAERADKVVFGHEGYSLAKGYQLGDTQGPRRYPHALELDIGPESVAVEAACAARTGSAHTHEHPKSWFRTLLGRFDVAPSSSTPGCPFTMSVRIFAVFFAVPSFRVLRRWKYSFLTPGFRAHLCQ